MKNYAHSAFVTRGVVIRWLIGIIMIGLFCGVVGAWGSNAPDVFLSIVWHGISALLGLFYGWVIWERHLILSHPMPWERKKPEPGNEDIGLSVDPWSWDKVDEGDLN